MSRGKRHRPLRTGVKRRRRERNAEAVVRFRYFFQWLHSYLNYIVNFVCKSLNNNAVVRARVGQSDGHWGGGIGAQGGRDGYAAQGEAHGVSSGQRMHPRAQKSYEWDCRRTTREREGKEALKMEWKWDNKTWTGSRQKGSNTIEVTWAERGRSWEIISQMSFQWQPSVQVPV